jgi:segregation and condensation protein A
MRSFDLEVAGEFLVMASTLMFIKSRELLPVEQQVVVEGEDEGEDPRWELIRQLVEYKKFKDAAAQLQSLELRQENIFPRRPGKLDFENPAAPVKTEAGIFDLLNAVNAVLKRFQQKEAGTREIFEDKWTVSEKMEFVLATITSRGSVKFSELFATAANRSEVVCTFLALLELIRLKQLQCLQPEPFAEIEIQRQEVNQPVAESPATEAAPVEAPAAAAPQVDPPKDPEVAPS